MFRQKLTAGQRVAQIVTEITDRIDTLSDCEVELGDQAHTLEFQLESLRDSITTSMKLRAGLNKLMGGE